VSKYKIGDRVRLIKHADGYYRGMTPADLKKLNNDAIGIIISIDSDGIYVDFRLQKHYLVSLLHIEPVDPYQDDIEQIFTTLKSKVRSPSKADQKKTQH
jgi:hypothetical protein